MNENIVAYVLAYLIGAIPFGLILGRIFGKVNITREGSCSIGATNVLRVLKSSNPNLAKKLAVLTVVCDAFKAFIPMVVAKVVFDLSDQTIWTMAVLSVIGHCFSPYLKFEGGKGVATGAGALIYFLPLEIICALGIWFIIGKVLKISSLASLLALFTLIGTSFIFHYEMPVINTHAPIFIISFVVLYKHIPNIKRLLSGSEKRVI